MREVSYKNHPFFQEQAGLDLGDEFFVMSPEDQGHQFLSRWLEHIHPYTRYAQAMKRHPDPKLLFRAIRLGFVKFVVDGNYSAGDYLEALDTLLNRCNQVNYVTIERELKRQVDRDDTSKRGLRKK